MGQPFLLHIITRWRSIREHVLRLLVASFVAVARTITKMAPRTASGKLGPGVDQFSQTGVNCIGFCSAIEC
jgi:hypothetical protein